MTDRSETPTPSESGDWHCVNCGYLSGSRVNYNETCDTCHMPVEFHTDQMRTHYENMKRELQAANAMVEELEREDTEAHWHERYVECKRERDVADSNWGKCAKRIEELTEELNSNKHEMEFQLSNATAEIIRLRDELAVTKVRRDDAIERLAANSGWAENEEIAELKAEVDELERENERMTKALNCPIGKRMIENEELRTQLSEAKAENEKLRIALNEGVTAEDVIGENLTLRKELSEANAEIERLKDSLKTMGHTASLLHRCQDELLSEREKVRELQLALEEAKVWNGMYLNLEAEYFRTRDKAEELEERIRTLDDRCLKAGRQLEKEGYERGLKDGRAVTGGSKTMPERDEATTESISADGAVPASEERGSSSPSVVYRCPRCATSMQVDLSAKPQSEYLRGFRDCRERAAKVAYEWKDEYGKPLALLEEIRAIEPGE